MANFDEASLRHFLKLAQRGSHPGASSGEVRAHRLALVVLEHAHGLDGQALDGLCEFARVVSADRRMARQLLGLPE
jgi:hypothetical protein